MATKADADALASSLAEYDTWLRVERGLAPNSLAAYRRDLRRYAGYLRRKGETDPATVSEGMVAGYVEELRSARDDDGKPLYAPSSIARAVAAVRSFHRFCVEEGLVRSDPSEDIGGPRVPQGIPKALSEAEVEALLAAVPGDDPRALRDCAILETLYAGGLRISELVGLERGDLDLQDGIARVLGKGSKERVVPLGRTARAALDTTCRGVAPSSSGASRGTGPGAATQCSSTHEVDGSRVRAPGSSCAPPVTAPASVTGCFRTCCGIRARPTCSTTVPTSAWCRSCSATPACPPPRCTRGCRPNGCERSTTWPTPGRAGRPLQNRIPPGGARQ